MTIFDRDRGQKTSLTKLVFSGEFLGCYIETAQNFIRYVTIFVPDWAQKTSLTKLVLKTSAKAVGGASERSERGRSALFKNPLFFSGKFLGCYIEAAQNSIRYVPFL